MGTVLAPVMSCLLTSSCRSLSCALINHVKSYSDLLQSVLIAHCRSMSEQNRKQKEVWSRRAQDAEAQAQPLQRRVQELEAVAESDQQNVDYVSLVSSGIVCPFHQALSCNSLLPYSKWCQQQQHGCACVAHDGNTIVNNMASDLMSQHMTSGLAMCS